MPEAVRILQQLGVSLDEKESACFAGISFHDGQRAARCLFRDGQGLGVRRTRLHERLAARAAAAGVRLHWGAGVQASGGGFASAGSPIDAGFFVIADGLCSTIAGAAGFRELRCASTRYAFRQPFRCAPWSDTVEVHWGQREQIYVTPLAADEVNIALLTGRRVRRLADALGDFPDVAPRLGNAECTAPARGAVTKTRALHRVLGGNVAVLGDASGSVDAITGEGLLSAFRQALALADALTAGELQQYAEAHRRIARHSRRMARLLLLIDRHPSLQRCAIAALAAHPECLGEFAGEHMDEQNYVKAISSFAGQMIRRRRKPLWPVPYKERGI